MVSISAPPTSQSRTAQSGTGHDDEMHPNTAHVVAAGHDLGVEVSVHSFPKARRRRLNAAAAIGVEVGQIVKSLVFTIDGNPGARAGERCEPARRERGSPPRPMGRSASERCRSGGEATGYPIGGVPPFGHSSPLRVFVDPDLLDYDEVWAAAGAWNDVFPVGRAQRAGEGDEWRRRRHQEAVAGRFHAAEDAVRGCPTSSTSPSASTTTMRLDIFGGAVHTVLERDRHLDDATRCAARRRPSRSGTRSRRHSPLSRSIFSSALARRSRAATPISSADDRRAAPVLFRALPAAADAVIAGERDPLRLTARVREIVATEPTVELEYVEARDAASIAPIDRVDGNVLLALAARLGVTRLIDNVGISVVGDVGRRRSRHDLRDARSLRPRSRVRAS